jgi:signal transduction histidine kinase
VVAGFAIEPRAELWHETEAMPLAGRFVVQSVSALLVIALLALSVMVGATIWLNEKSRASFEEIVQSRAIRSHALELRNAVQSAESSERGLLLTNNQIYLSPYGTAKTTALRRLDALRQMPVDALAPGVMPRLTDAVGAKFSDLDQVIALKTEGKDADALAIVRTNRGKQLMDEINLFASGIVRAADERIAENVSEQRSNATQLRLVSAGAALLIILVVGGTVITVYRYAREITRARDELDKLNASLEQRVAARTAALARANTEIQQFAHIVSHDLRAPLVNIVGFTSELGTSLASVQSHLRETAADAAPGSNAAQARFAADTDMPEALDFIRSSTRKMDRLINAILMISREGRRRLQPETVSLKEAFNASCAALQHQFEEADGRYVLDLQVESFVTDRLSLDQIIGNLLDNAVKYRAKQRALRVDIRTRRNGAGLIRIEIADNGRGVAERDLDRIFQLFKRAGAQDQIGDGVGLAYVQALVRNLGGEIGVTSQLDRGTTFSIVLPSDLREVTWRADDDLAA